MQNLTGYLTGHFDYETQYVKCYSINPDYAYALNNLANIDLQRQQYQEAEKLLKRCLKAAPKFATAWMNLGIAFLGQSKYKVSSGEFYVEVG